MPALTIINGVCSVKINKMVEQSAFLEGLLTCSLKDYIKGNINRNNHHILLFLDSAGRFWIIASLETTSPVCSASIRRII